MEKAKTPNQPKITDCDTANITDEQILQLTEELQDEQNANIPLIGPQLPLTVLEDEYQGNDIFVKKLKVSKLRF